jgi:hypothetical protein
MEVSKRLSDFPKLVVQYVKGQEFSPDQLNWSSNRRVKWVCELGHEWEATVAQRTRVQTGCPFCSNQRAWPGLNDLATRSPAIAAQWHPTKNGNIEPSEVLFGSHKKYWWLCPKGHEWDSKVSNRTARGSGCRVCSGNEVQQGYNDLATKFPDLAREWHPFKNDEARPTEVSFGSASMRWWLCPESSHDYEMRVSVRTGKQKGQCPYCSNQKLLSGFNDLATRNPELAGQWDYELNFPLTPSDVAPTTNKPFWWKCPNGLHSSWKKRRTSSECPVCLNQVLLSGFNDVATRNPELAAQWHPTLNGEKTPEATLAGGRQKVSWLCEKGHHWQAGIYRRPLTGCPYCKFKRLWPGFNDLASVSPDLASEWHPTKNGKLTPRDLMSSVARLVWWQCPKGHAYQASPNGRSRDGPNGRRGCNICASKVVLKDVNHLSVTHPHLWLELVKEGYSQERLDRLFAGSTKRVRWRCREGHEWEAVLYSRAAGNGCPDCAEYGFKPNKPALVYFLQHKSLNARKVGITNTHTQYDRVAAFNYRGWEVVRTWAAVGKVARSVESQVFAWVRGELQMPQYLSAADMGPNRGETETFSSEGPTNAEVESFIEKCVAATKGQNSEHGLGTKSGKSLKKPEFPDEIRI